MAEKQEDGLIGFDPLAWMDDGSSDSSKVDESLSLSKTEQEPVTVAETKTETEEMPTAVDWVETEEQEDIAADSAVVLEAVQNIQNISGLYDKLLSLFEQTDKIEIDASAVMTIDTATLQLLIVLKQSAVKAQKEVVFDFPSERFIEAAELLGLAEMLDVEKAAAGFF